MNLPEQNYPDIAHLVSTELHEFRPRRNTWTPQWDDDIADVYRVAGSDLDELVLGLIHKLGKCVPSPKETKTMPAVRTVRDLVSFLGLLPNCGSHR